MVVEKSEIGSNTQLKLSLKQQDGKISTVIYPVNGIVSEVVDPTGILWCISIAGNKISTIRYNLNNGNNARKESISSCVFADVATLESKVEIVTSSSRYLVAEVDSQTWVFSYTNGKVSGYKLEQNCQLSKIVGNNLFVVYRDQNTSFLERYTLSDSVATLFKIEPLEFLDPIEISSTEEMLLVSSKLPQSVGVEVFTKEGVKQFSSILQTNSNLLLANKSIVWIRSDKGNTTLFKQNIVNKQILSSAISEEIFSEQLRLASLHDSIVVISNNKIIILSPQGKVLCAIETILPSLDSYEFIQKIDYLLVFNYKQESLTFNLTSDSLYFVKSILTDWATNLLWISFISLLLFTTYKSLQYKRQVSSLIDNSPNGIVLILNRDRALKRINKNGREFFQMDSSTPLRRNFRFYCNNQIHISVYNLVDMSFSLQSTLSEKITAPDNTAREIVFTISPFYSFTGAFDGVIVSGVDITEELERKRLVNWAQLAHDMQTNLSIIKLNSEQLRGNVAEGFEEKRSRIFFQTSILLQRVRDIVSLGRDETLHLEQVYSNDLFSHVVQEFDDTLFEHIQFKVTSQASIVVCDKAKMIRAIRNAVENAIRAIGKENGIIELQCIRTTYTTILSIKDNGCGMDENTKNNMLKPFFSNYRQYGGTGIGTMIILRTIELHKGTIEVESEISKGTTMSFVLPNLNTK